jgi:hypothetical protein
MTNPPQGSDQQGGEVVRPASATPSQPYGQPAPHEQPYAAPSGQDGVQPLYGRAPQPRPQLPYGQPPYGPPGQQPYPAPAQKSYVGLIAGVTAGIVALIAVAVVLALTLGGTVLDRTAVERDVAAQFEQREGVAIQLRCADDMAVATGSHYECSGTTADGENVTLRITVTDEATPAYTWTEP